MKSSERNISQCILALWYFKVCCRVITYHNNMNVLVKRRSSRPEVFCRKDVLRNFAKFTGKHLRQSLFFSKVAGLRPEISKNIFSTEHLWWLLL